MTKKIGFLVGSLRKDSLNKKVAEYFAHHLPEGFEAKFIEIGDLPLYNEDIDMDGSVPESYTRLRQDVQNVDGLFFFTPEYNRSIPATIKNALDVGSRPYGQNSWDSKPALVVSVSQGAIAGFGANHHLRQSLVFLNVPTLQQPEAYIGNAGHLFDENGTLDDRTASFFQTIISKYIEFFEKLS